MADREPGQPSDGSEPDWQRRVVGRSLRTAAERSVDRGLSLIAAAGAVLERSNGGDVTVQEVADEAGQSLRTLYQYFESKDDLLLAVFEEAMRTYAQLIAAAIEGIDDPLDRLAGAMLAALRMPELTSPGLQRGLARLRLSLAESGPERVGRAQQAVTTLIAGLLAEAAAAGAVSVDDVDAATFMLLSLNAAAITTDTLGNDAGVQRPPAHTMVAFCLRGLGADVDRTRLKAVEKRLQLPRRTRKAATRR